MINARNMIRTLGNEPPLLADGRRAPDRREISLRWLSGTFLTGITSSILMGVALFAALDGRQQLAIPAEASASLPLEDEPDTVSRGGRLLGGNIVAMPTDRKVMEVSTVVHEGNKEIIRRRPFAHVKMNLAANHVAQEDYPDLDPLTIFSSSEGEAPAPGSTALIYGSEVESEVSLRALPFPASGARYPYAPSMSLEEVEENVRSNGSVLTDGNTQLSALYYVDPQRFSAAEDSLDLTAGLTARIVEQNMSVAPAEPVTPETRDYADDIIPIRAEKDVATALKDVGYPEGKAEEIAGHLGNRLSEPKLFPGDVLRIGVVQQGEMVLVVRASIYRRGQHEVTIALNDHGRMIDGEEPPMIDAVAGAFSDQPVQVATGRELPRVYDGIYRAALSYGMTTDMTGLLVKLLASSVDLQAQLKPTDRIEAFFSAQDESGQASEQSELLYVNAHFGDTTTRFYRFQDPQDGAIDYYDAEGRSIRQFLLRNPVPNGRLTSGFGMRRHPILRYARMHTGTDWAAPRGTPIIAAGNGVVETAGWDKGGYGNQTIIRHANGYVSSYNHQSAIAKGIKPGAKVKQGQVIGYVGSTGLSTGAHLHYELIVNGSKVDPMKIRLPGGKSLEGDNLARFKEERTRIDALLGTGGDPAEVASR
jgi:murein DD-endopeptidase MepM/ murein hydrolase activator NlpD